MNPRPAAHPVGRTCTVIVCPWSAEYIGAQVVPTSVELIYFNRPNQVSVASMLAHAAALGRWVQQVESEHDHGRRGNGSYYPVAWMVPNGINPYDDTDEFDIDDSLVVDPRRAPAIARSQIDQLRDRAIRASIKTVLTDMLDTRNLKPREE